MEAKKMANKDKFSRMEEIKTSISDGGNMTKEERKNLVLGFMSEYPLALPPLIWYRNMRIHRTVTFGRGTLENYIDEFVEEGLVARVDKEELDNGKVVEVADEGYRAYYMITDKGLEQADRN